ncbi:ATP-binding protein [Mycobacterium sp. M1]|uniref:ATP-binding protein n=1 Tax=Mycolicibacter acidiphilus TaxID=2835306 RepID=A0ABS5RDJ5_9MYCO|nr:ATP-binding protein [Mycolicibacter acidiphilus]MBS9532363.1 ATP-binding protein [Mycolicibacter acidiphilus]
MMESVTVATNGSRQAPIPENPTAPDWIRTHPNPAVRDVVAALSHLLAGTRPERQETGNTFAEKVLGVTPDSPLTAEQAPLTAITRITFGLVLADWITEHGAAVGPHGVPAPPSWTMEAFGEDTKFRLPQKLSAGFPAGTLADVPVVIRFNGRGGYDANELEVVARPSDQAVALEVLEKIRETAKARNPYRGRWLRVTLSSGGKLGLLVETPPETSRDHIVADETLWRELDLAIRSVAEDHERLRAAGLGCRRGVLLSGPPGVGKSAVCAAVAAELHRDHGFTVLIADPKVGESALTTVMRQAAELAGDTGTAVILEDLDLFVPSDRRIGGRGLAELLAALDAAPTTRLLTLASTNSVYLDKAAVREGRFDAKVAVAHPDRMTIEKLLSCFLQGLPEAAEVDVAAVAGMAAAGETSGAALREAVRRAVLGGPVTTASLGTAVREMRARAEAAAPTDGSYL